VLLALTATLAIVIQDHTALRAAPNASATELTTLWQGDVVELRGERAGYLKVYNYRRERGGFLQQQQVRSIGASADDAPELLAILRFLADTPGQEALGISYGAAYLKAVSAPALSSEALDAIGRMSERLADQASGHGTRAEVAAHLEVVEQFGIHMHSFERAARMQVCYEGELFRRVLMMPTASAEARAHAALAVTRPDCIDPSLGPLLRAAQQQACAELLDAVPQAGLTALSKSRLHARRAVVWAALTYQAARSGNPAASMAQRALGELLAVHAEDLGEDLRGEYSDATVRVAAVRFAALAPRPTIGPLTLAATPGAPGETCLTLQARSGRAPLLRRCTYGIAWLASAQWFAQGRALALAVQPLESWRELWVFHEGEDGWTVDVLDPGLEEPEAGYVDFAGFVPGTRRVLVAREVQERGRVVRRFEELRLSDLLLVKQASRPELLIDFGRWQDPGWRRDTLAMRRASVSPEPLPHWGADAGQLAARAAGLRNRSAW
jgi:hypothetical protein